jgi:ubiquitin carboxyl-terminal hydrolase 7
MQQGEPFSAFKQRISDFTKIKGKQLDKIKFALVARPQYSKPEYIDDGKPHVVQLELISDICIDEEILWDTVGGRDDISIGLDHTNKSRSFWGKTDSIFIR